MKIKLADLIIDIGDVGKYTKDMCKDYECDGSPDIVITPDIDAIEKETAKYPDSPADYIENICLYRNICNQILDFDALLIHSAAISVDGKGYMFSALSGTGKTTHVNLWLEHFKDRAIIVNGDKPIVRKFDGKFHVYGTPWSGKEGINNNIHVPIEGICILERGQENHISPVSPADALTKLMEQTVRARNPQKMIKLLDLLEDVVENVPIYKLFCNMNKDAAIVSYNGMCKKEII